MGNQWKCHWEEGRGRLKPRAGNQERRHHTPAANNLLNPASTKKNSDAPDQGAPCIEEMRCSLKTEISELDSLNRQLSRDEVHKGLTETT